MKLYRGMPPLFLGLGPQWARNEAITPGTAGGTVVLSMLINAILPPIWNDTVDTTPQVRAVPNMPGMLTCRCADRHFGAHG